MNPWHDVSPGENIPNEVHAIIEIPKKSTMKYEVDKETGMLVLDRAMYSAVYYPGNYGFVPQTYWEDGDPLDIIVMANESIYPLTICNVRPVGVLTMTDNGESDDKVVAVVKGDPRFDEVKDISDFSEHVVTELKHFFETYKLLQGKEVVVMEIRGAEEAKKTIEKGIKLYQEKFPEHH